MQFEINQAGKRNQYVIFSATHTGFFHAAEKKYVADELIRTLNQDVLLVSKMDLNFQNSQWSSRYSHSFNVIYFPQNSNVENVQK